MEKLDVLAEIRRIVEEEWAANSRPVLLSKLPRTLESTWGMDYRTAIEDKSLKVFLQENADSAGIHLVQDPAHHARVGVVPVGQDYVFAPSVASSTPITAADARAFGRVLGAMTVEEQRTVTLPTSFVARLLAAR